MSEDPIRVVYHKPNPYVVVNAELESGVKLNNLILKPEEARDLSDMLYNAFLSHRYGK